MSTAIQPEAQCRPAAVGDAISIGNLIVAAWQQAYADLIPTSFLEQLDPRDIATKWQAGSASAREFRRVVSVGGRVVAACSGGPARATASNPDLAELYSINVHPEYWGKGIGSVLLLCAQSAMIENDFSCAILWVLSDNARAQRFYSKAGWHPTGEEKCTTELTGSPLHEVCLRLPL